MLVIAHRGASAAQPENTLAAFDCAVEQKCDWIETDLHVTRDGVIALVHDASLERIGGTGVVGDSDWADLQCLDAGAGERIPSLETALDHVGHVAKWNLEIKVGRAGRYPGLEAEALRAVAKRNLDDHVLFSSFHPEVLRTLRRASAGVRLGVLPAGRFAALANSRALRLARELRAHSVHPAQRTATRGRVSRAQRRGLEVYPYTADTPGDWERLARAGVDGIFTNCPGDLRQFLERREGGAGATRRSPL